MNIYDDDGDEDLAYWIISLWQYVAPYPLKIFSNSHLDNFIVNSEIALHRIFPIDVQYN